MVKGALLNCSRSPSDPAPSKDASVAELSIGVGYNNGNSGATTRVRLYPFFARAAAMASLATLRSSFIFLNAGRSFNIFR